MEGRIASDECGHLTEEILKKSFDGKLGFTAYSKMRDERNKVKRELLNPRTM